MMSRLPKLIVTAFALVFALLAVYGTVDTIGRDYTEAGLKRALITYGVARGLNGVISVAQGTELAFEPAGIGLVLTPGQILDPINDLIERFSWIMLASATSLGMQRVLLNVAAWPAFTAVVSLVLLGALLALWWPRSNASPTAGKRAWQRLLYRFAMVLLILRFAIPVIAILNEGLYSYFLEPQYTHAREQLERAAEDIGELNAETRDEVPPVGERSWLESAKRGYQAAANALNVERRLDKLKQAAADMSEHAINLIVVFTLQTIIFPLLFLWLVLQLLKRAAQARFLFER